MFVCFPLMLNLQFLCRIFLMQLPTSTGIIAYVLFVTQGKNVQGIAIL